MNRPGRVKAYPWGALESTTRAGASALRDVRRWAAAHADLSRLSSALSELLDAPVRVILRRAEPLSGPRPIAGGAAVTIAPAEAPQLARAIVVEADVALVATATARVVERRPPRVLDAAAVASPASAGALAAIVAAALRRANEGMAMRVLAAGPAPALEADVARLGQELLGVALTVLLADDAYEARVVLPRSAVLGAGGSPWNAGAVAALGSLPLSIPVVAHALVVTALDLARLGVGDALMLEPWPLGRAGGRLAGPVRLAAPSSSTGVAAQLGEDGRLVLRGEVVPLCAEETEMTEATDRGGIIEAIGDVPVVVRVEIGEASMPAREWASLGAGDVVALGRRVGEAVTLRVGGVPVARGDLVEIEGEVGVRIVERLGGDGGRR